VVGGQHGKMCPVCAGLCSGHHDGAFLNNAVRVNLPDSLASPLPILPFQALPNHMYGIRFDRTKSSLFKSMMNELAKISQQEMKGRCPPPKRTEAIRWAPRIGPAATNIHKAIELTSGKR